MVPDNRRSFADIDIMMTIFDFLILQFIFPKLFPNNPRHFGRFKFSLVD